MPALPSGNAKSSRQRHTRAGGILDDPERTRMRQSFADLGGGPGAAETEALHGVNAGGAQEQVLLGGLHALRRHLHAETAAEAHHRMHDRGGVRCTLDRQHEAAVDLELVERETAQIEQARIAGAEIVERELHDDFGTGYSSLLYL